MKIAHIVSSYPPYYGGMGNVVLQTASELANRGHDIEVITPLYYRDEGVEKGDLGMQKKEQDRTEDYASKLKPSIQYGNAARLPQVKKKLDKFDVVHLHYPFFGTANIVRKWKMKNKLKPLVITYHMDTRGPGWKGLIFKYYSEYWMPKILGSADALLASSFDYIQASDAKGIFEKEREKWIELPFGVDLERFKPRKTPESLLKRHDLDFNLPISLFVGGMDQAHHFKGIPYLFQALLILKKNGTPVQCLLVGDGDLRSDFELQAKGLGISNLVRFAGKVSDDELPYYYNLADLFVLPSISKAEAFGMVLLEAMASGIPVVASDLPGVRSVAKEGGVVIEPGNPRQMADAMYSYLIGMESGEDFPSSMRRLVEYKYNWKVVVDRLEQVYQQLAV